MAFKTTPSRFIGCDVGKEEIVVFDSRGQATTRIANTPDALACFAATLDPEALVICEATGGYEAALLETLVTAGRTVHRADARKVKAFIRSFGTLGKNDALDARAIARYGEERHHQLPRWQPADKDRLQLSALVLTRQDMIASRTAWRNRRKAPGALAAMIDPICQTFDEQIRAADAAIKTLLDTCQKLKRAFTTLRTIKGMAAVSAPALLALMPELGTLNGKQAAALAGLAPHPNQSGSRDGYRPIRGGRPDVRKILFMAALSAAKHDPQLKPFYQRLVANGKKRIVAITAVMRKIIIIANARLRDANQLQLS